MKTYRETKWHLQRDKTISYNYVLANFPKWHVEWLNFSMRNLVENEKLQIWDHQLYTPYPPHLAKKKTLVQKIIMGNEFAIYFPVPLMNRGSFSVSMDLSVSVSGPYRRQMGNSAIAISPRYWTSLAACNLFTRCGHIWVSKDLFQNILC